HGLRLTYAGAAAKVDSLAAGIAASAGRGDRVVIATGNSYAQQLLALAVCRAGAIAVPVNPQMRPEEVDHVVGDSGASLVIRNLEEVEAVAPLPDAEVQARRPAPGDVAAIFYTSGTTGRPKGAELSHRALIGQLAALALVPTQLRRDELIASLPVAHIMGFSVLLAAMVAGVPVYFLPRFNPVLVLDAIERRQSTIFIGVPAMYRLLLEAGAEDRDLSSIRVWGSGADVMPPDLARRFQRFGALATLPIVGWSIGDAAFVEGYGMVETGGAVATKVAPPGLAWGVPFVAGSLGVPMPRYRFRVIGDDGRDVAFGQIGELLVRGPGVLAGYHGDAEATAKVVDPDGWLHTGDLARRGLFGLVSFAGRAKDVIKSGGYSVYAVELERVMEEHPDVVEAAAVGVPDDRLGERPAVAVLVRAGATVTESELLAWAEERLADYKRPRLARIVDELPRTGTQKVAKSRLMDVFAA
ncbi:MAG: class I adenylate-forming enzyme family protein, partial [Acidimicrobiales bacterium]